MERPKWIRKKAPEHGVLQKMEGLLKDLSLNTVCREANCPNIGECFGRKTATFMILGALCTRQCPFCNVTNGTPDPANSHEPLQVAQAVAHLGLKHVVVTSVTRDDLPDGGAGHFAATIKAIKELNPSTSVEVLVPDFAGDLEALKTVIAAKPEVLGHNLETVPSLYPQVRPRADYQRSLELLTRVKALGNGIFTKSGIMLGLGETEEEIQGVLQDLLQAQCDIVTIGQYLRPSADHLPIVRYPSPEEYEQWREQALEMGFGYVASSPFVRSSFEAGIALERLQQQLSS